MQQLILKKVGGAEIQLMSFEPYVAITKGEQKKELMGGDVVELTIESKGLINFSIGDVINVFDQDYKLNELPAVRKIADYKYEYSATFEGSIYDLLKVQFLNADVTGGSTGTSFDITGDMLTMIYIVINNANRVYPAKWSLTGCPVTETKTMQFSEENCLSALQNICKEFEYEFDIRQIVGGLRYLNILKIGTILPYKYEYGKGRGLNELSRIRVDNKSLITRLYAYGSDKNLNSNYRNYAGRLKFNDNGYIEKTSAIAAYGLIEGTKIFEEVFPNRKGTVTAIDTNKKAFFDSGMFDLNETDANGTKWLIAGNTAKISFLTGNLAGYEFNLSSYTTAQNKFIINEYKDSRGEIFPSATVGAFQIQVGDVYTILDIRLPDSYIVTAENELKIKAQNYLEDNSQPAVMYTVSVDEMFLKDGQNTAGASESNLPDGWVFTDVGGVLAGFGQYISGFVMIGGSGTDLVNTSFMHRALSLGNNISATLQLDTKQYNSSSFLNVDANYGIMVRFGLANNDKFVAFKVENGQQILTYRSTVGGAIQSVGQNVSFDAMQRYGLLVDVVGLNVTVKSTKNLINKFSSVLADISFALTAGEITAARIGYFLAKTNGTKGILKIKDFGIATIETALPTAPTTTPIGAFNYINIANGNNGNATFENGIYTLINAGTDIWDNTDSFGYLFLSLNQTNTQITATIAQEPKYSATPTDLFQFARGGLMFRVTNDADSRHISIGRNANGNIIMYSRVVTAGTTDITETQITNKPTINRFFIKSVAASVNVSGNRLVTVTCGYIENGAEVVVGTKTINITNAEYSGAKIGIYNLPHDATLKSVLRASNLAFSSVASSNNPCNKPTNLFYSSASYEWGATTY